MFCSDDAPGSRINIRMGRASLAFSIYDTVFWFHVGGGLEGIGAVYEHMEKTKTH